MKNTFTFKKEPLETGLRAVGHPYPSTIVKHDKKECGSIQAPSCNTKDRKWGVSLMVLGGDNPNCPWHWITLGRFETEPEAREWLQKNGPELLKKYTLHHMED